MSDGTSNRGPLTCPVCKWPLSRHLTPCPPELPLYDATDCAVPLMQPERFRFEYPPTSEAR